jgi:small-conductance mechanosensitive channel
MYSIFCLGIIMILDSFGLGIPAFVSPIITFGVVGFFLFKSIRSGPAADTA